MPPKPRPNAKKPGASKKNAPPPKVVNLAGGSAETASGLSQEAEDQFELELCWCIQQLGKCLASGKLAEKQAHDLTKNINILKSNTAPMIKKRQVMRNTLGNYREKMALDEQKFSRASCSMKFVSMPTLNKKCVFVKKAECNPTKEESNGDKDTAPLNSNEKPADFNTVQNVFKFNFQIAE